MVASSRERFDLDAHFLDELVLAELGRSEKNYSDDLKMGVVFEEIIDLRSGVLVGHEVLTRVRVKSPRVGPETWFAKARALGVVAQIEARAVELALEELPNGDGLISVNFSPDCLETKAVQSALDRLADLDRVTIVELAEHHHTAGNDLARALAGIRERGILIAVDDAGTGQSGPEFIREVDPDVIKIDRNHISQVHRNPAQRMFLHAFCDLARQEALLITEGVSSERVHEALSDLANRWDRNFLGQGYWLSKMHALRAI